MSRGTKKAGSTGRYGTRYGVKARKQIKLIEDKQKAAHTCPECGAPKVKRVSTGIWECAKCGYKFAGGAYVPQTGPGIGAKKALKGIIDKLQSWKEE
ncbi:MAG: 50S ribosomal protein L37ae [Thermoplasmata archaeon HGW-Thermoplasmata-1]|nr:MAG: 50S ribosomal protein L37ae [Thermoplasmata archaeon HGW-Thermoplasmata-1]